MVRLFEMRRKYFFKVLFSAIILFLLTILLGSFLGYSFFEKLLMRNIETEKYNQIVEIDKAVASIVSEHEYKIMTYMEYSSEKVAKYQDEESIIEKNEIAETIESEFVYQTESNRELSGILVISEERSFNSGEFNVQLTLDEFEKTEMYLYMEQNKGGIPIIPKPILDNGLFSNIDNIVIGYEFSAGYIFISVDIQNYIIADEYFGIDIMQKDGDLLWERDRFKSNNIDTYNIYIDKMLSGERVFSDTKYYYVSYMDKYREWVFIIYYPKKLLFETIKNIEKIYILFNMFIFVVICFSSYKCTKRLIRPLENLTNEISQVNIESDKMKPLEAEKSYRKWTLRKRLLLFYIGHIISIVICLMFIVIHITNNVILPTTYDSLKDVSKIVEKNISFSMNKVENVAKSICLIESVQMMLYLNEKDNKDIISEINRMKLLREGIAYIKIYNMENNLLFSTREIDENFDDKNIISDEAKWLDPKRDISRNIVIPYTHTVKLMIPEKNSRLFRLIKSNEDYYRNIGSVEVGLLEYELRKLYQDFYYETNIDIFISNESNTIISSNNSRDINNKIEIAYSEELSTQLIRKENGVYNFNYFLKQLIEASEGSYLNVIIPTTQIYEDSNRLIVINIISLLFLLVLAIIFANGLSSIIVKPLKKIWNKMEGAIQKSIDIEIDEEVKIYEIEQLTISFNRLMMRIRKMIEEVYDSKVKQEVFKKKKAQMELIALQSQINPHFLYNTFSTIKFMVLADEKKVASKLIEDCGQLFRMIIYRGEMTVSVKQEIEYLKSYLSIQKIRYGEKLNYIFNIDKIILDNKILKLILQPIVENAIYHGIELNNKENTIWIEGKYKRDNIIFIIEDDGLGMGKDKLIEINKNLNKGNMSKNIGLVNVNERIKMYYGKEYRIEIESEINKGTKVKVIIPIK